MAFSRPTSDMHVQVEWDRGNFTLRRVHDSDPSKDVLVDSLGVDGNPHSFAITILPVGDLVVVYLGDRLAFKTSAKDAPISNTVKIGVVHGQVNISAVQTRDTIEEDDR